MYGLCAYSIYNVTDGLCHVYVLVGQSRRAVIDVGVIELIKRGDVSVVSGMIKACCPGGVEVKMKTAKEAPPVIEQHPCDVIILATVVLLNEFFFVCTMLCTVCVG